MEVVRMTRSSRLDALSFGAGSAGVGSNVGSCGTDVAGVGVDDASYGANVASYGADDPGVGVDDSTYGADAAASAAESKAAPPKTRVSRRSRHIDPSKLDPASPVSRLFGLDDLNSLVSSSMTKNTQGETRRIVFVLGAGASVEAGCPLLNDFFRIGGGLFATGKLGDFAEDWSVVEQVRNVLSRGSSRATVDINNLESVFSAVEMMDTLGIEKMVLDLDGDQLKKHFVKGIAGVLMASLKFPIKAKPEIPPRVTPEGDHISAAECNFDLGIPLGYASFTNLLSRLLSSDAQYGITIVTFNYDIALEAALSIAGIAFSYGLPGVEKPESRVTILKLHGSVNWMSPRATDVEHIRSSLDADDTFKEDTALNRSLAWATMIQTFSVSEMLKIPKGEYTIRDTVTIPLSSYICDDIATTGYEDYLPLIVPPAESKLESRRRMSALWFDAHNAMINAETFIISGYSMPPTDQFFRHLYSLSGIIGEVVNGFWVFDKSKDTIDRFQDLVGGQAKQKFIGREMSFSEGMKMLADAKFFLDTGFLGH
jgi:hypothetical protein